jgi:serine phosphatase RsbU (regulator of sigma subunit)
MPDALTLIRLEGPDDDATPTRLTLDGDTAVGRAVENEVCLPMPSVSRHHAAFRRTASGWFLTDEGSTSGTTLNARRLEPGTPAPLEPGDRIGIGPWLFRVADDPTATRTVGLTIDQPGTAAVPISSRRLDALSQCLDEMERAGTAQELALAVLRASMQGTGFGRAAVLLPPVGGGGGGGADGAEDAPVLLAGLVRTRGGVVALEAEGFAPSSSLIEKARTGVTAVHTARPGGDMVAPAHSIAEMSIHSAVCVPVRPDRRVAALIYLDARSGESPVRDAAGYCEDIARLYAFALTRDAQADLKRRQESLRIELERARELRAMLAPAPAARCGMFRHASRTIAGLFVSADLFDAIAHPDGSATVLFGDASGHGVGAAMLAALVQSHLVSALAAGAELEEAVTQTNRFIATRPTGGRFVSLVAARLAVDGSVRMIDAGHGHWMIARRDSEPFHAVRANALPLGVDAEARFGAVDAALRPGDRLVCYTDGIPDQVNQRHEAFGFERFNAAVRSSDGCETDVLRVFDALLRHADARPLDDDATVASVQFDPM